MILIQRFLAQRYNIRPPCSQFNGEKCREYFTDLQLQAEDRQKEIQRQKEAEKKLEVEHVNRITNMWDNGEVKVRSRQQPREVEPEKAKQMAKKMEYCNELQKMINHQSEQRKTNKTDIIQSEREVSQLRSTHERERERERERVNVLPTAAHSNI